MAAGGKRHVYAEALDPEVESAFSEAGLGARRCSDGGEEPVRPDLRTLAEAELRPVSDVVEEKGAASGSSQEEVDPEGEVYFGHGADSSDNEAVADLVRGKGEGNVNMMAPTRYTSNHLSLMRECAYTRVLMHCMN